MAKQVYEGPLVQQKGSFQIRGIIASKNKDTARKGFGFSEGKTKMDNKPWKSIRFSLKTAENNVIPIEKFGSEQDWVYFYSKKAKNTIKKPWSEKSKFKQDGYEIIKPDMDLVQEIEDTYNDGDSCVVVGHIEFSKYTNSQTQQTKLQKKYIIDRMYSATEQLDLTKSDYIEENKFIQEIVIQNITEDSKEGKTSVEAYVIGFGGKFESANFEIDIAKDPRFNKNFKNLGFGTALKVNGKIHNRALTQEVEDDDGWGKKEYTVKSYYDALEITGAFAETIEMKKYTEDNFVVVGANTTASGWGDQEPELNDDSDLPFNLDD